MIIQHSTKSLEQHCDNIDIKYFDELIEIDIKKINNNVERFKIYDYVLKIFKLNKVTMIIKYCDNEYLVYNEKDLKRFFKIFKILQYFSLY